MYRRLSFLLILLSGLLASACSLNPNIQDKGAEFLQGVWNEDSVVYQDKLLQYTQHQFTFTCDSVYARLSTTAKVNTVIDSCYQNGHWTEYAKGNYLFRNDTLFISATFTKPDYKQKISGCHRIGLYLKTLIVKRRTADTLYLQSPDQHLPITLVLKQKIICNPKPID
ncbi:fumarate hydratase (plasmid) [Pedobacter sp. BS3]|uniref:fumarate hydratase n=1 Tax=Pedobacter sp. BS3 TaxID=2567937 RepID=UPI0011EBDCC8|nr:fumarate hydratase [Pedobacter sp. BS3]TZF85614.1 fumarate hydratase [Pedobacter sp. BS3]